MDHDSDRHVIPFLERIFHHRTNRLRNRRRYEREQAKLRELSRFPAFQPLKPYKVSFIHEKTSLIHLYALLNQAKITTRYTIDTEGDYGSNKPTLIQVEYIDEHQDISTVLLFEMAHLPPFTSRLFQFIQKLFAMIFQPTNTIFTWDAVKKELLRFVDYRAFDAETIARLHPIDLQKEFKTWYNGVFPHQKDCIGARIHTDHPLCHCSHRPYKHPNDQWALQMAVAKTYHQFLDKRLRKSIWSIGLDPQFQHSSQFHREKLINYVVFDCLSVTKLAMAVRHQWTREQLNQFNVQQ